MIWRVISAAGIMTNMTRCGCILTTDPKKVKSNGDRLIQKNINGSTYGFDEYGIMLPWWTKVASVSNADKSNPTSDVPARFLRGMTAEAF